LAETLLVVRHQQSRRQRVEQVLYALLFLWGVGSRYIGVGWGARDQSTNVCHSGGRMHGGDRDSETHRQISGPGTQQQPRLYHMYVLRARTMDWILLRGAVFSHLPWSQIVFALWTHIYCSTPLFDTGAGAGAATSSGKRAALDHLRGVGHTGRWSGKGMATVHHDIKWVAANSTICMLTSAAGVIKKLNTVPEEPERLLMSNSDL